MKRFYFNEFEKVASEDLNEQQLVIHQSIYEKTLYPFFKKENGFLGEGFSPSRLSASTLQLLAGRGFRYDATQTGNRSKYRAIQLNENLTLTVGSAPWAAAPVTDDRIDIIVVRPLEEVTQQSSRFIRTGGVGPVVQSTVDKIFEELYEIDVVEGVEDASPVAPSTPAGWLKIAEVTLTPAGIVDSDSVVDTRNLLLPAITAVTSDTRFVSPSGQGTDTTLASAIANLPVGGGTIFIMENITLDTYQILPAGCTLRGLSRAVKITLIDAGQVAITDDSLIENITIETALTAVNGMLVLAGMRAKAHNVKIVPPEFGTNTCILISDTDCEVAACDFSECDSDGTNTSIEISQTLNKAAGKGSLQSDFERTLELSVSDSPFQIKALHSGTTFLVDTSGGEVILVLPPGLDGINFKVKDQAGTFDVEPCTLEQNAAESIEGIADDFVMEAAFGLWGFFCKSTNWFRA